MKDGKFETQSEIFQALLNGKKIKRETWAPESYIHLVDGKLRDEFGDNMEETELYPTPHDFLIYEEPKPKKKITLYRYTYKYGSVIHQTNFISKKWSAFGGNEDYLLLTESKEVEVDDV